MTTTDHSMSPTLDHASAFRPPSILVGISVEAMSIVQSSWRKVRRATPEIAAHLSFRSATDSNRDTQKRKGH